MTSSGRSSRIVRSCGLAVLSALLLSTPICRIARAGEVPEKLSVATAHVLAGIKAKKLIEHARELCDPELQGREAGLPGARKAAEYVAEEFRKIGLRPGGTGGSYYQPFKIRPGLKISSELTVKLGKDSLGEFKRNEDYVAVHVPGGKTAFSGNCIMAGFGISAPAIKFDEYAGLDVKGKVVIVFSGVPWGPRTTGWLRKAGGTRKFDSLSYKAMIAADKGATCLLMVENPAYWRKQVAATEQLRIAEGTDSLRARIPVLQVTRNFLAKVSTMSLEELRQLAADIGRDRKPHSLPLRGRTLEFKATVTGAARIGRNVVGILPGRDEALRKECVVLGAHHDHLGAGDRGIFFGANDNAAGVAAVLEIARAFAGMRQAPRRSVVFVTFDAEEIGRIGSRYYTKRPPIPMDKTVLMINFDMIGKNARNEINAVGTLSSPGLHRSHQEANKHIGLKLVHPRSFRLGRSDHTFFYYSQVPVMYLFGGLDVDYNTPRDTPDRLLPDKIEKVARLAYLTAFMIAEEKQRIKFRESREHPTVKEDKKKANR